MNSVALPAGWALAVDPVSDRKYYFNREKNLTSWTAPTTTTGAQETEPNVDPSMKKKSTKRKKGRTKQMLRSVTKDNIHL